MQRVPRETHNSLFALHSTFHAQTHTQSQRVLYAVSLGKHFSLHSVCMGVLLGVYGAGIEVNGESHNSNTQSVECNSTCLITIML